jgi:antimicrobial peptide system SdpA family protein
MPRLLNSLKMKKIFFLTFGIIVFLFINFLFISSINNNTINLKYRAFHKNFSNVIFPEGWAFFTRNPRENKMFMYKILPNNELQEVSMKNSEAGAYFGIDRKNRVIYAKISKIIDDVKPEYWNDFSLIENKITKNEIDNLSVLSIKATGPMIYGDFVIMIKKITPFAWYCGTKNKIKTDSRLIILKIKKC